MFANDLKTSNPNVRRWLIVDENGNQLGIVEKFRNTRKYLFPWRVYRNVGFAAKYIGCSYSGIQQAMELLND